MLAEEILSIASVRLGGSDEQRADFLGTIHEWASHQVPATPICKLSGPVCPRCKRLSVSPGERYCSQCGQLLSWAHFKDTRFLKK